MAMLVLGRVFFGSVLPSLKTNMTLENLLSKNDLEKLCDFHWEVFENGWRELVISNHFSIRKDWGTMSHHPIETTIKKEMDV